MDLATLVTSRSLHVAAAPPLLLAAWTGQTPNASDFRQGLAAEVAAAKQIGRAATVVLVHETTPLPDDELRKLIATELRTLTPYLVAGVTVVPQQGFKGAAARALVSTLQLIVRPGYPERVVSSYAEAAGFLFVELSKHHAGLTPVALQAAIEAFAKQAWG